jgi:hypothetical protein
MTIEHPEQVLVVLTSPPTIESQLIDWLLSREDEIGFTSCAVHGHSTNYDHLSIAEQVIGRQRRQQIQVRLRHSQMDEFIVALATEFADSDLHYWVIPLLAGGRLSGHQPVTNSTESVLQSRPDRSTTN